MEILTILKANIRHKKGSFVSIILLMAVISMALTSILSVQDNIYDAIQKAHERMDTADVIAMIDSNKFSDQLLTEIESHSLVRDVKYVDMIPSEKLTYNKEDYSDNPGFLQKVKPGSRLFNEDGTDYLKETPALKKGEIYIVQGMRTNLSCKVGDTITFTTCSRNYDFRIAGIIEDPLLGASVIGWKNAYISDEDFERIYSEVKELADPENNICTIMTELAIYKAEKCDKTDAQFARQLNLDTGFSDMSLGVITKEKSSYHTYLLPQTIGSVLLVFVLFLLIAVVVIMCHSVSTGIEMEYTALGVMKSQGFTKGRIRLILAAQYLIAQVAGAVIGMIPAVPLCRVLGDIFYPITAIVPLRRISIAKCSLIILGMLLVSGLCILYITRKIANISPVRAISGGRSEIYFDSRIKAPISKRALSLSLAFRQFTSNKRQYAGVIAIVSLLVFFMTTMMVLVNTISATSAWKSMGILYCDISLTFTETVGDADLAEIEDTIREYSAIEDVYHKDGNYYCSVDGEEIMACVYGQPDEIPAVAKGRAPLYDNEIVITEIAADNLGLKIGDTVTIGYRKNKAEYVITGLNQYMNDAGNNISITMAAAGKLWKSVIWQAGYTLSDRSAGPQIVNVLNETYGDILIAEYEEELMDETFQLAIYAMTTVVYIFSAIFAVVVVHMVCSKAFLRERRDIGIYKALGFTSPKLRSQFAARFLIVALIGSAIGSVLAAAFSGNMLSSILRMVGISEFTVTFRVTTFAVPVTMVSLCFCLFSYMASRKIKKVEVKELVVE